MTSRLSGARLPGGEAFDEPELESLATLDVEAVQAGVRHARFLHGHIEDIPLPGDHVDVVISNCVINLSADKPRVLAEAFRVLKPGGRLGVSDVIADDAAEQTLRAAAERRAGCLAGTLSRREYHDLLTASGFSRIRITAARPAGEGLPLAVIQAVKPVTPTSR